MCSFVYAQSFPVELNKVRKIRLLESNREDVKKILADYKSDKDENKNKKSELIYSEFLSSENAHIEIDYTQGNCSDGYDEWNVPEGKVKSIKILPEKTIKFADFNFDFSNFLKEKKYANVEDLYVYHNKNLGIAFDSRDSEVESVHLFPTSSFYSYICENEEAESAKEFYSTENFFGKSKLKDRVIIREYPASISSLTLSANEITIGCNQASICKSCFENDEKISVITTVENPQNDVLTYNYTVSAGKIVGQGSQVVWDLTGVEKGTHTITVKIDDGCGDCATPMSKTIFVK